MMRTLPVRTIVIMNAAVRRPYVLMAIVPILSHWFPAFSIPSPKTSGRLC
jgi:hypothetical protein